MQREHPIDGATRRLAAYAHATGHDRLPEAVVREAPRAFVNIVGCMVGGARHPAVEIAERTLLPFAGPPQATAIGRGRRTDILSAALLNGLGSAVNIYDDTHAEAMVHPSGPVAAAALALAEHRRATGADFLAAFVLGIEVACRLSKAVSVAPARGSIAWSQTGICCGIGAAVAAGRLLELDVDGLVRAIGIAASQAAGLRVMHGSMCTPLMPAQAAQAGLRAALLAADGFSSSAASLEGKHGFMECFAAEANPAALTDGLGERFEFLADTYKPFPCGIVIHPMIDACLQLGRAQAIDHRQVERIDVAANPTALALCDRRHPKDASEAHVSLQHWMAAALVFGRAGVREGSAEAVAEPAVVALRDRIETRADPAVEQDSVDLLVHLKDGRTIAGGVRHCLGSASRPMTDRDLEAKFEALADGVLAPAAAQRLLRGCWQLAAQADVGLLLGAAA